MNAQARKSVSSNRAKRKEVTQIPVSFGALPEEIERWKAAAKEADRPLSWWIRNRLLALDAQERALVSGRNPNEISGRGANLEKSLSGSEERA
ncbi:MAG: hypothetical protein LAO08_20155 [Acidobacteriia bacterium]|nr:hypothetical protein [Terriglobia bacterium]